MYILGFKTQTSLVYEKQSDSCTIEIRLPVKCNILLSSIFIRYNENEFYYQINSHRVLTSGTSEKI